MGDRDAMRPECLEDKVVNLVSFVEKLVEGNLSEGVGWKDQLCFI